MKRILLITTFTVITTGLFAQLTAEQRIEDSVIGWWDNNRFDNRIKPSTDPVQKKRVDIDDMIVGWMKKTYTPVGGLGTVTRQNFSNGIGFGVYFMVWDVGYDKMWLDEKGHFKPIPEENTPFAVSINQLPGTYPVPFLNTGTDLYFTWPPDGYFDWQQHKEADPKIHPNVYKYITRINEIHTVYLAPNNKLPFETVTRAQYLDGAEASLDREFQKQKEKINSQWSDTKSREDAYAYQQKEFDRYRNAIHKWREKYKAQLNEPAILHNMQPTLISDFFGDMDPFAISDIEKSQHHYYPLHKVTAAVLEKCKTAQPQWIAVWFRYQTKENGNQLYEMYRSMTEHLNYDYIYNYFFDPEKVKGVPYRPAKEEELTARLNAYRKKMPTAAAVASGTTTLPANVFFADNFSGNSESGAPANWYFRKYGKHAFIAAVKDQPGKWLQLGYNNPVSPTLLKKPLPENFTLEYDMATDGDFSSRTGGAVTLSMNTRSPQQDGTETMGGNGTQITITVESGNEADYDNNNYRGVINTRINSLPAVNTQNFSEGISHTYALREFTNKKTTIHVAVKLKSGVLSIFINNKQVAVSTDFKMAYGAACAVCGIPAGSRFSSLHWKNTTNDADNIKTYIGNIKITKE